MLRNMFDRFMRRYFDADESGGGPAGGDVDPAAGDKKPDALIFGKFKSIEEAENAYKNLEGEHTRKAQELADLKRTQVATPPPPQHEEDPDELKKKLTDEFFEDPIGFMTTFVSNVTKKSTESQLLRKRAVREYCSGFQGEPIYDVVKEEFEDKFSELPDEVLRNPTRAKAAADDIFTYVTGKYARNRAKPAATDPKERKEYLSRLGVEKPDSEAEVDDVEVDPRLAARISSAMGLGKDAAKAAADRVRKGA